MTATEQLVAALPRPETIADPYPLYARLRPQTPEPSFSGEPECHQTP